MDTLHPQLMQPKLKSVEIKKGDRHLLEFGFDGEADDRSYDFRPLLPIVFRW